MLKLAPEEGALRGAQTLARGLEILRILVENQEPLTATELAIRTGTHQSSASRLLKALIVAGYVRKVKGRGFTVDSGVFELAANATRKFSLTARTHEAMDELGRRKPDLAVTLGALWNDTLVYPYRVVRGEPIPFSVSPLPLHLSTPALLFLLERPENESVDALRHSRARYGWDRPTHKIPETEAELLKVARRGLRDGVLILDDWQGPQRRSGAIRLEMSWAPGALAYSGTQETASRSEMTKLLRDSARTIEATLTP